MASFFPDTVYIITHLTQAHVTCTRKNIAIILYSSPNYTTKIKINIIGMVILVRLFEVRSLEIKVTGL